MGSYCHATDDGFLCWPDTQVGVQIAQPCPPLVGLGFNENEMAYRKCGLNGLWDALNESTVVIEKSNFDSCLHSPTSKSNYHNENEIQDLIFNLSLITLICLSVSFCAILTSVVVYRFVLPRYINEILRVKIHKHLFFVLAMEHVLKLILQINILLSSSVHKSVFCEILAALTKYLEMSILVWIISDCHFAYMTAKSGFLCISGYKGYLCIGYILPLVPVLSWVISLVVDHNETCWNGHMKLASIWIIEIPKILIFVVIGMLLLLSACEYNKRLQLHRRKESNIIICIKSITVISVLLFLSNLFVMVPVHLNMSSFRQKATVQYISTILTSLKGLYIALLCNYSNIKSFVKKQTQLNDIEI